MAYNELSVLANTSRQIEQRINQAPENWRFIVKTANLTALLSEITSRNSFECQHD